MSASVNLQITAKFVKTVHLELIVYETNPVLTIDSSKKLKTIMSPSMGVKSLVKASVKPTTNSKQ